VEETGKVFPSSDKALHVLQALLSRLTRSGAKLQLGCAVSRILQTATGLLVQAGDQSWVAPRVVLTTGGQSYPGCGTTGDGYRWARELGHHIVTPRPALVPISCRAGWVHSLKGITIPDASVRVVDPQAPVEKTAARGIRRGSILMTHVGLSGPAVLDVSREVSGHPSPHLLELECDFLPAISEAKFDANLQERFSRDGRKSIATLLPEELPRRLSETLMAEAGIPVERRGAEAGGEIRRKIVQIFKRCRIPVTGTLGFPKAEVTAGGVALGEVDSRTMQSRIVPGLSLAGEVLDLDGPIGGYNFQAAFSTAWLAADRL
jgi:predicted Rossmann fold flavoprotein